MELQSKYLDDFVLYPYEVSELALRLVRLFTRSHKSQEGKILSIEGLEIDTESFEVTVEEQAARADFQGVRAFAVFGRSPGPCPHPRGSP